MKTNYFLLLIVSLFFTACGTRECDCDELYLDKDSVYRIPNNNDKEIRKNIARLKNLKHLIVAIERDRNKMIGEMLNKDSENAMLSSNEMNEEEIKRRLEEQMEYEMGRLEIEKKKMQLIVEEKEIEIKLQRAEIKSFTLTDTETSTVYTGKCKSYYDKEKTKLKSEAEFNEGKISGVVKHYTEDEKETEANSLLK